MGALLGITALLGLRAVEHARAVDLALGQMADAAPTQADASAPLLPSRVLASPDPFSPFHWHAVADFGSFLQLEELDTRRAVVSFEDERLDKPPASPALESALNSRLGRVYIDWSPMPVLSVNLGTGEGSGGAASTVVYFRDPRFMGAVPLLNREGPPPLSGAVELDRQNRVVTEMMNGREQR